MSGIGKKDILDQINVPVKLDLPGVGENLSDHTATGIVLVSTTALIFLCFHV